MPSGACEGLGAAFADKWVMGFVFEDDATLHPGAMNIIDDIGELLYHRTGWDFVLLNTKFENGKPCLARNSPLEPVDIPAGHYWVTGAYAIFR